MPLIINTNVASLNAQRFLTQNTSALDKSMEKLSSGYRINKAGDDAAGLALSEKLRAQIRGNQKALDNVQDGINVLNIADGAMQGITDYLQRMRELAVQAGNDTYNTSQRSAMKAEIDQLASGITQISDSTQFNGVFLLTGTAPASSMRLQIGANSVSGVDTLDVGGQSVFNDIDATALAVNALFVDTGTNALTSIAALDTAISTLNTRRGNIGALTNRLEATANNLSSIVENTAASESRIRNVDVAMESARLTRNQILQQASAAMLSQANQAPQLALQLLRG
jgi:flagellin